MNLFVSTFVNKIDKKGRVSFPSLFRNALPKGKKNEIILYKSLKHKSIEGCNVQRIEEIARMISGDKITNAAINAAATLVDGR